MPTDRPKGLTRARLLPVLRVGDSPALTGVAVESLFRSAEFLFEGKCDRQNFFASFMMQVSIACLGRVWRKIPEPDELKSLLEGSVRVRVRLGRLALREVVARYPSERLGPVELDTRVFVDRESVRIDLDLEAARILLAHAADSE